MILGYTKIKQLFKGKNNDCYQPNTLDLQLETIYHPTQTQTVGLYKNNQKTLPNVIEQLPRPQDNTYVIEPGEVVFAEVKDKMTIPEGVMQTYKLRSSLMRMGLTMTSSCGDTGFNGHLIFQLYNPTTYPIRICKGERFATCINHEVTGASVYDGSYQED